MKIKSNIFKVTSFLNEFIYLSELIYFMEKSENKDIIDKVYEVLIDMLNSKLFLNDYFDHIQNHIIQVVYSLDNPKIFDGVKLQRLHNQLKTNLQKLSKLNNDQIINIFNKNIFLNIFLKGKLLNEKKQLLNLIDSCSNQNFEKKKYYKNIWLISEKLYFEFCEFLIQKSESSMNFQFIYKRFIYSLIEIYEKNNQNHEKFLPKFKSLIQNYTRKWKNNNLSFLMTDIKQSYANYAIFNQLIQIMNRVLNKNKFNEMKINTQYWQDLTSIDLKDHSFQNQLIINLDLFLNKLIQDEKIEQFKLHNNECFKDKTIFKNFNKVKDQIVHYLHPIRDEVDKFLQTNKKFKELAAIVKLVNLENYLSIVESQLIPKMTDDYHFKTTVSKSKMSKMLNDIYDTIQNKTISFEEYFIVVYFKIAPFLEKSFAAFYFDNNRKCTKKEMKQFQTIFQQNLNALQRKFDDIMSRITRVYEVGNIRYLIEFINAKEYFQVKNYILTLSLNQPINTFKFFFESADLEKFFKFRPLLENPFFKKVFNMLFVFNPKIREKAKVVRDSDELRLLIRYLRSNPQFKDRAYEFTAQIDLIEQIQSNEFDRDELRNFRTTQSRVESTLSLKEFNSGFEVSFEYCLFIKSKFFDVEIEQTEIDPILVERKWQARLTPVFPFNLQLFRYIFHNYTQRPRRELERPERLSSAFGKIELSSDKIEEKYSMIVKIQKFKTITANIINLVDVLSIRFKDKTLEQLEHFRESISDETLPIERVIESFNELPQMIRDSDQEKLKFIANFCSESSYIGRRGPALTGRPGQVHQRVLPGAEPGRNEPENPENRGLLERRAGRAHAEGARELQSRHRVHQEAQETEEPGQVLPVDQG